MANLYVDLLKDSLNEYSYMAELAGLKYTVNASNYGLNVSVSGFSDKMDVLLETVVERMATLKIDPQRFAILKVNKKKTLLPTYILLYSQCYYITQSFYF